MGVLTAKSVGKIATLETLAAANTTTTLPTTSSLAQGLENFTADDHNTSTSPSYSPTEVAVVLALLTGVWQVN